MAKKKVDEVEVEVLPPTKTVDVVERHMYSKEVPIVEEVTSAPVEEPLPDVFSTFNEIVTSTQNATLRIWRLPNYEIDGRASASGTEREYCGSVQYDADNAALLDQIQGRVPMGGMLQLELYADGRIAKRGLLKLMKAPSATAQVPGYPHVTIQNPAQPVASNGGGLKEQVAFVKDIVSMARDILPPPPQAPVPTQQPVEQGSLKDQILEKVVLQAFTGADVPADRFDKVISALGGGPPEPSVWDTLVQAAAPHLGNIFTQIAPGVNALLFRFAGLGSPPPTQPMTATTSGVQTAPEAQQGAIDAPPVDPAERAWRRVLNHLLDDLFYHVELLNAGANGVDVSSSAEAVYDLLGRFNSHPVIQQTVGALLTSPPEQVLDLCAMMFQGQPVIMERIVGLKGTLPTEPLPEGQEPVLSPACAWLVELQERTKEIISEADAAPDGDEVNDKKAV